MLVALRSPNSTKKSDYVLTKFGQECLLHQVASSSNSNNAQKWSKRLQGSTEIHSIPVVLREDYKQGIVLLENPCDENSNDNLTSLAHPSFCPVLAFKLATNCSLQPSEHSFPFSTVKVTVSVILETADGKVLLTRRSKHLRSFPGIWVSPGGHIDEGESIIEAAIRELKEETGVEMEEKGCDWSYLGLWESVYPPNLALGPPKRHCVVAYLHIRTRFNSQELDSALRPCPTEVDMLGWLSHSDIQLITGTVTDSSSSKRFVRMLNSNLEEIQHPLKCLLQDLKISDSEEGGRTKDLERVSTGTKYAMNLWLEKQAVF